MKISIPRNLRRDLTFQRKKIFHVLENSVHPGICLLQKSLRRTFKPQKNIPPLEESLNVPNYIIKDELTRIHQPFELTH
ncbi:Hypothetical protein FKW44_018974 [Caligus rogercresseyi]|uniref:Uncharacterized protein n=1 Tax=Caligus rogercresseyi TaxID=217165 RepID=A0A7T8JX70_CALRO|nr:Hypothetical protein FKW44_018974 [Caligus rogercresseyi]